ncbi:uncharacterized protein LOC127448204 [Myxocyprinus asiaticus]|uniref:uncharacterized protein LOC127448204 n=1 Tax=Myxocyprinus asiaticus TaxID=70543 RepID=UPI002221D913|nr:uncharacterized protein LOC127448204 [Myxocyprinus asiaticus]XP_051566524.1 uncharacterized protein LOC127448204 [Myxocyprinus asiaticus]
MEVFHTRTLHLNLCVIITLLIYAGSSKSTQEQKVMQHINKTVSVGETVTLHCNRTPNDEDFTWKMNNFIIFRQDTYSKNMMTNFTSERMFVDPEVPWELKIYKIQVSDAGNYTCYPAAIRCKLTIIEKIPESLKQIPLYIVGSCSGVIMFLTISLSIWIHRIWKNNTDSGQRETGQDFSQSPNRGMIQTQNSHYFERYNSVYGQI